MQEQKTSDVVREMMDKVSAELEPSPATQSIYKNLEKVLEALATVQSTVDACVTGVMPPSSDVRYTHSALRVRDKRKAIHEELQMVPLKKAHTASLLNSLTT